MENNTNILLVGFGKMGGAMLMGWINSGINPSAITVIEPSNDVDFPVRKVRSIDDIDPEFYPDVIIFAIKPQIMADVLPQYSRYSNAIFLSIAAGKKLSYLESLLGEDAKIVRAMPNLPALISKSFTVAIGNNNADNDDKQICEKLLQAIGQTHWSDDEAQMDAVTAMSGSGPAYLFLFIEAMIEAGVAAGLPKDLAESLSYATILGSSEMASQSEYGVADLRENVTSPNGTTEAALSVLMKDNAIKNLLKEAVLAAKNKSSELGD